MPSAADIIGRTVGRAGAISGAWKATIVGAASERAIVVIALREVAPQFIAHVARQGYFSARFHF
jgi:hypothetical protein